jgi:mutator protein MutT
METLVGVILSKDNKILVEIRKKSDNFGPGAVWIPGGHVEKNETPEEAMLRESAEEFGIKPITYQKLCILPWRYKNKNYKVQYFASKKWKGKIKNKEAAKLLWISKEEINKVDAGIDRKVLRQYFNQN